MFLDPHMLKHEAWKLKSINLNETVALWDSRQLGLPTRSGPPTRAPRISNTSFEVMYLWVQRFWEHVLLRLTHSPLRRVGTIL